MKKVPILTKFRKAFTKRLSKLKGQKGVNLSCFSVGLRQISNHYFTYEQLESSRRAISRLVKPKDRVNKKNQKVIASMKKTFRIKRKKKKSSKGFLIIKSTLVNPITKKPLQVRMGKGKGAVDSYVYTSKNNRILLEMARKKQKLKKIQYFFQKASIKLPGKSRFFYTRNRREKYFLNKNT